MSDIGVSSAYHRPPVPAPGLEGRPADGKLWQAAREFEEIFMAQFVKSMRASVGENELLEKSAGRETFDAMFSEAIARNMVETGSFGLARAVYRDMGGKFVADAEAANSPPVARNPEDPDAS